MQELYRHQQSSIHDLDARVKFLFTLAFLIFLNLTPYRAWPAYILFFTVAVSIALLSRAGIGRVLKRSLFFVPFILAALPLIFTGAPPFASFDLPWGGALQYSLQGVERFLSIAVKSWISVQAAVLLAMTTRFPDLMTALQQLRMPRILVAIITLMWRYLYVIGDEASRMMRARSSRSAISAGSRHAGGSVLWRARVTGGMAGSLFLRAIERSERVYAAMLSRGYTGELPAAQTIPITTGEKRILFSAILLLAFLCLLGFLTGG